MENTAYIRLFHSSFDAPKVDVMVNNILVASNLSYSKFTPYIKIKSGASSIKIFPSGSKTPVISTNINFRDKSIQTLAVGGYVKDLKVFSISDDSQNISPGKSLVRFASLSQSSKNSAIYLTDGTKIVNDISFGQYTDYVEMSPRSYNFKIISKDSNQVILSLPNMLFKPSNIYTIYITGEINFKNLLIGVVSLDGKSYIKF